MIPINLVISIALLTFAFGMLLGIVSSPHAREEECGAAFRAGRCEGIEDAREYVEIMAEVEHRAINDRHAAMMELEIVRENTVAMKSRVVDEVLAGVPS